MFARGERTDLIIRQWLSLNFPTLLARRHPERSRFSGEWRDLARGEHADAREIPRPAGENAGLRDDASGEKFKLSHYRSFQLFDKKMTRR
jgi:hypothetical protein